MNELNESYHAYDVDRLQSGYEMRIERRIYFEYENSDITALAALPLDRLRALLKVNEVIEQEVFKDLRKQAAAWEEQAGKVLLLRKTLEYVRTPEVEHTSNQWEDCDHGVRIMSNRTYKMHYRIFENTKYDWEAGKSIPCSYSLSWSIYTNSSSRTVAKIAGQERKVFKDKAAMEKYLNGRIKAYAHLFTEISPPIPPEYAECFKVNGLLLPGYTIKEA